MKRGSDIEGKSLESGPNEWREFSRWRRRHWINYDFAARLSEFRTCIGAEPNEHEQWAMRLAATKEYDAWTDYCAATPAALERIQ